MKLTMNNINQFTKEKKNIPINVYKITRQFILFNYDNNNNDDDNNNVRSHRA